MIDQKAALKAVESLWKDAESRLKRTEVVQQEVCVAAINQLRYAGYHLIAAFSADDTKIFGEQLSKCQVHCERASYDAIEAEVLVYLEAVRGFKEDYKTVSISVPNFDYFAVRKLALKATRDISEARSEGESRGEFYQRLDTTCKKLGDAIIILDDVREELNKTQEATRTERRLVRNRWLVGLAVTAIVGFGAVAIRLCLNRPQPAPDGISRQVESVEPALRQNQNQKPTLQRNEN